MTVLDHETVRTVDEYIDEHHEIFSQLGGQLFDVFGYDEKNQRISSQIRNLQRVACSAIRFADIEDFVKNQMGKNGGSQWQAIGKDVLTQLQQLRSDTTKLSEDKSQQMAVRLRLARAWVRAVVSEYLYRVALAQMERQP